MVDKALVERFLEDYYARLFQWVFSYQDRMWDWRRFGPEPRWSLLDGLKRRIKQFGSRGGWVVRHFGIPEASREVAFVAARQEEFARVYSILGDDYSRQTYLDVLAFRVLGGHHVRMPVNTPEYWAHYNSDHQYVVKAKTYTTSWGWDLNLYDVPGKTGALHLNMAAGSYLNCVNLQCYDYLRGGQTIGVKSGDVVIDGGGCWGEMAVIFADRCAPDGHVYTFEFSPDNVPVMRMNLEANPALARRVTHVERAIADVSGKTLTFSPNGPGTRISGDDSGKVLSVLSTTADDFVEKERLEKVDFIKLDIEGSEMAALRGAVRTLQRFRPSLAVSLYHKREDLYEIPLFLHNLGLGYNFFVDHFTVHREETVLSATVGTDGQGRLGAVERP